MAASLGQVLMRTRAGQPVPVAMSLLVGLAVFYVAANIPFVGGLVRLVALLLGLGIAWTQARSLWLRTHAAV